MHERRTSRGSRFCTPGRILIQCRHGGCDKGGDGLADVERQVRPGGDDASQRVIRWRV